MRPVLWLLLVAALAVNVYVTSFSGYHGVDHLIGSASSGVVAIGAGVGLWLTRPARDARSGGA
ncbi:hypothetical protein [Streptomyces sp. NPDC048659]|uniref:hypothetical protein n=1 Tax=Streptomyces sp. NPDC048659 TaxID=3155489 RepID=UPI0034484805